MMKDYSIIRESAARLGSAADRAIHDLLSNEVEQEHQFTDRMLGRFEEALHGFSTKGVRWSAKTLTDRGANAQETKYGADFMGVLSINLPDFSVKKGFLAQSKLLEPGFRLSKADCERMKKQCELMLKLSPDSFLFVYSTTNIIVIPAISVISMSGCDPHNLYARSVTSFFQEHFECFIGDRNIYEASPNNLEDLMKKYESRKLLSLGLTKQ